DDGARMDGQTPLRRALRRNDSFGIPPDPRADGNHPSVSAPYRRRSVRARRKAVPPEAIHWHHTEKRCTRPGSRLGGADRLRVRLGVADSGVAAVMTTRDRSKMDRYELHVRGEIPRLLDGYLLVAASRRHKDRRIFSRWHDSQADLMRLE